MPPTFLKDEECSYEVGEREGTQAETTKQTQTGVTPCSPNTAGIGTRGLGDRTEVRVGKWKVAK